MKSLPEMEARLPAHSVKPPVMMELLELEDAYEMLAQEIRSHRAGLTETSGK